MALAQILSNQDVVNSVSQAGWRNEQYQCGHTCSIDLNLTLPAPPPLPLFHDIPKINTELYLSPMADYLIAYNPKGRFGIVLLNSFATKVLYALDGQQNINQLATNMLVPPEELAHAVQLLAQAELVYTEDHPRPIQFFEQGNIAVWMHITNQCNLRCTYCYIQKSQSQMSLQTGKQALDQIFATASQHHQQQVLLKFAGGEALTVFPLLQELTAYARMLSEKYNITFEPIILTNGTPINPEMAQAIAKENYAVSVTLDGLDEYNDQTRPLRNGKPSFKLIERGIQQLLKYKVRFNISVVVTRHNLQHLPTLTRYLLAEDKNLSFTFNFLRENELAATDLKVENEQLIEWIGQAYEVIQELLPSFNLMNSVLDRVYFNSPHLQACGAGSNYIVVKHTGEIVGCQMHMQKSSFGRVQQPIDLLTQVQKFNFIATEGRTSDQKIGCSTCQWRYVCAGGCPIMTYLSAGRYDTRSPFCDTYKALIPRVLQLEALRILKYAQQA
jgi:uncharacterized protein